MRIKMKNVFTLCIVVLIALTGCQSIGARQDVNISMADEGALQSLAELEEAVVRLDAAGANSEELAGVRRQATALQGTVADNAFEALLAAWSGRLYLMEGRASDAQREYRRSQSLSPLNIPSQVLSFRLEQDLNQRLSMIAGSLEIERSSGELLVERGRVLFDMNRFAESVAAFDTAFVLLSEKPYYEDAYRVFRDKAWELRNLQQGTDTRTMAIAGQGEITWSDMIEITKNETDLLRFITAGRDWPAETIFAQLIARAFIPYTQNAALTEWPSSGPASSEVVLRAGAAWFLWHLNAENRANRGLLTRYSARLANNPNAQSPIPDISLSSPFIDSVLGCVESEFMSLPDGRNFMPNERVRGSDFLAMLRKL
jgi:tetratricopeptide (TPR) repeat protein